MSILESQLTQDRTWGRVGDFYQVTRKPRGLSLDQAIPFAPMESIPQGGAYDPLFAMKAPNSINSGTYFERGDILVAKITPSFENGKQALVRNLNHPFGYATTEVIPLQPRDSKQDPRLLFFYLLHPDVRHFVAERMEGSTGRQRVPESVLLDLPIPTLEPEYQTAIADALEALQRSLKWEFAAECATAELKRSVMKHLFTRGLRAERQKETEIGPIPESWAAVHFGSVRQWLQYGTSIHCTPRPHGYPVLRIPNVAPGRVNATELKYADVSPTEAEKYRLENGDILFIRTNGVLERLGSCAVYTGQPENALFASYLIRARLNADISPRYVAYFYESELGTSLVAGRATPAADGKYNLNTGTIDALPLALPPTVEEQEEIVKVLNSVDCKIDLHKRKRAVLEELFRSLLHKLMTGEIRVADLDLPALDSAQATLAEAS